jgi:hypothetical protein
MNVTQLSNVVSPNLLLGFKQLFLKLPEFMCRYVSSNTVSLAFPRIANSGQHGFTFTQLHQKKNDVKRIDYGNIMNTNSKQENDYKKHEIAMLIVLRRIQHHVKQQIIANMG